MIEGGLGEDRRGRGRNLLGRTSPPGGQHAQRLSLMGALGREVGREQGPVGACPPFPG